MSLKIKFFTIGDDDWVLKLFNPLIGYDNQSYAWLWCLLEGAKIVEWPFQSCDAETNCTIKTKLEKFNKIGLEVFVIPTTDVPSNGEKWQKVGTFGSSGHAAIEELELGYNLDLSTKQIPLRLSIVSVEGSSFIKSNLKSILIP